VEARRAITIMQKIPKPISKETKEIVKKAVQKPSGRPGFRIEASHPLHSVLFSPDKKRQVWDLKGGESAAKKYASGDDYVAVSSPSSAIASSLVDPLQPYTFRLAQAISLTSSSAGSLAFALEWDPAVIAGSDWTAVTTLFNQVRLVRARLHLSNVQQATVSSTYTTVAIASNISSYAGTPSSYTVVVSQPDARIFGTNSFMSDPHAQVDFVSPTRPNKLWAAVGTPAPAIDTGCYGAFQISHFSTTYSVASARIFEGFMEVIVEVRGRA